MAPIALNNVIQNNYDIKLLNLQVNNKIIDKLTTLVIHNLRSTDTDTMT